MAQPDEPPSEPPPAIKPKQKFLKGFRFFSRPQQQDDATSSASTRPVARAQSVTGDATTSQRDAEAGQIQGHPARGRTSRSVVPGLPRAQTFKRQLSENRSRLAPIEPSPEERRAVSMDRHSHPFYTRNYGHIDAALEDPKPFDSGQGPLDTEETDQPTLVGATVPTFTRTSPDFLGMGAHDNLGQYPSDMSDVGKLDQFEDDLRAASPSLYNDEDDRILQEVIARELESTWILNLSMRYKDRSKREKFFVTYRENEQLWRRVTVTLDYRDPPEDSLEEELRDITSQKDKSCKIYESIRQSLPEIQFYDTVTNLKLETTDGRLHVHVVEDANEIIQYPHTSQVAHIRSHRVREEDIDFIHHMSGFVYKVSVGGETLIKKEIPGPETIDEFLYEINALDSLRYSENVIKFYGLVIDEHEQVKGLLISYANGGALIDIIYDNCKLQPREGIPPSGISWELKARWAEQIVNGLADVHECGFVQGDFTLSNIVIDEHDDAKIIDINRRGCPVGWEPPEATPLLEAQHRISMYIGVKSDLFQLGMVLWAIAMDEDEPERERRPLTFEAAGNVPDWYRRITEICLNPDPRKRLQAAMLLQLFPKQEIAEAHITVDDGHGIHDLTVNEFHPDGHPRIRIDNLPQKFWSPGRSHSPGTHPTYHYAPRGRSPPSPMPSNYDDPVSPGRFHSRSSWAANRAIRASYSDAGGDDERLDDPGQLFTPDTSVDRGQLPMNEDIEKDVDEKEFATEIIEGYPQDSETQPRTADVAVVEDAQATPTQENGSTVTGAEDKSDTALQEVSGNVIKSSTNHVPVESTEDSMKVAEKVVESPQHDPDDREQSESLETAAETPSSGDALATADGEIQKNTAGSPEDGVTEPKETLEEPLLPQTTATPTLDAAEGDATASEPPAHKTEEAPQTACQSDDPSVQKQEATEHLDQPATAAEAGKEDVDCETNEQLQETAHEKDGGPTTVSAEAAEVPELLVAADEEANAKSEADNVDQPEDHAEAPALEPVQETEDTTRDKDQGQHADETDTLPTATTDPAAAVSEPATGLQAHDGATPRTSPCAPTAVMSSSDSLAGMGCNMELGDNYVPGKDLTDEDFQIADQPGDTKAFTITADATT